MTLKLILKKNPLKRNEKCGISFEENTWCYEQMGVKQWEKNKKSVTTICKYLHLRERGSNSASKADYGNVSEPINMY